jgi:hypothetical protein
MSNIPLSVRSKIIRIIDALNNGESVCFYGLTIKKDFSKDVTLHGESLYAYTFQGEGVLTIRAKELVELLRSKLIKNFEFNEPILLTKSKMVHSENAAFLT